MKISPVKFVPTFVPGTLYVVSVRWDGKTLRTTVNGKPASFPHERAR